MKKPKAPAERQIESVYSGYAVDEDLVRDGIKFELEIAGKYLGWVRMRPADRDLNGDYRVAMLEMGKKVMAWQKENPGQELGDHPEQDLGLLAEAYADSIIMGWHVLDESGEVIPSTREAYVEHLPRLPKMFTTLQNRAKNWGNWRRQFEADAVKP